MSERKNIDRLFQESFKDYEVAPPLDSWKNIEERLQKKDKKRRIIPFWLQFSGIAAALILGWLVFQNYFDTSVQQNEVVNQQNDVIQPGNQKENQGKIRGEGIDNDIQNNSSADERMVVVNPSATKSPSEINSDKSPTVTNSAVVANSASKNSERISNRLPTQQNLRMPRNAKTKSGENFNNNDTQKSNVTKNEITSDNSVAIRKSKSESSDNSTIISDGELKSEQNIADRVNSDSSALNKNKIATITDEIAGKVDSTAIVTVESNSLEELLNEKENNVTTKEQKVNRWQISSNVAPIYFSSTSEGSPIDPQFSDKKKNYKQNLAYGVGVRYALNKKFTIRAGVNSIGMEYSTKDAVFYQTANAKPLAHVNQNLQGSVLQIESKSANSLVELTPNSNLLQKFDASVNQRTGYYEVPVELSYKLVDNKFGVDLIGGVSTLFLNENSISMTSSGTTMEIGKANNLNNTHFSTNFGLGIKYNLLKSFQLNLEPMIKYQFDTFSDSGNYQPFFFGIYSGINYRF